MNLVFEAGRIAQARGWQTPRRALQDACLGGGVWSAEQARGRGVGRHGKAPAQLLNRGLALELFSCYDCSSFHARNLLA